MKEKAEACLKQGDLDGALEALQNSVRDDPSSGDLRVFLFQLLAVKGDWGRALTQLNVSADLDSQNLLMAQTYRELLQCEGYREAVFSGERSPLVFGEPPAWIGEMIQALTLAAKGDGKGALEIVDAATSKAEDIAGVADEKTFNWLIDADMRLGPIIEAVVNGKYYWVPQENISEISFTKPEDLRDLVWLPVEFTWATEGKSPGFIPARYPMNTAKEDDECALGRKTEWSDIGSDFYIGSGLKMLATDDDDIPLFTLEKIQFNSLESD